MTELEHLREENIILQKRILQLEEEIRKLKEEKKEKRVTFES
jgi:hypothetical protein